jgi:uncharacterized protein YbjT (DUF2867 family)
MDSILVTGGTGTLGRHVVRRLRDRGAHVRVLTRGAARIEGGVGFLTGNLLSGEGIADAVEGVDTVIHCAGESRGDELAARNLVDAAKRAARPHVVFISVVGAERVPVSSRLDQMMFGYFAMKKHAEEIVATSGLPWTTLRATQFYDLVFKAVEALSRLPIVPSVSGLAFQPIDSEEVAARLVGLALGPAVGLVSDMAGPRTYSMGELLQEYLSAAHLRRWVLPLWLPGKAARAVRAGANLSPSHAVGRRSWEDFLTLHLAEEQHERRHRHPRHAA